MIKLCDTALVLPLSLIFEKSISTCVFPDMWKKANVLPIHKKESRRLKKNYRPISLLPICGKIFEKIIFDASYDHLCKNQLLTSKQSGFRPGDSTVNQLIAITHQIHTAFEKFPSCETRAVFLDIFKAFDKVWHEGLLFKLKSTGISGDLLKFIQSFLSGRQQGVVLNGKNSEWHYITAGVPQGSVLRPLFLLVYINDLVDNICSDAKLFADDTSLFKVVYDEQLSSSVLNNDLETMKSRAFQWKMQFNPDPNEQAVQMIFSCKRIKPDHPLIFFNDTAVNQFPKHTHLGMTLDSELTFALHIQEAITKARKGIGLLRFMSKYLHRDVLDQFYKLCQTTSCLL